MVEPIKKKKTNIKKIILGSLIGILIGSVFGITVAMFTYNSESSNSKLLVGDIYMRYKESNALILENAMPSNGPIEGKYFEFDIIGKNTTTDRDIWFEVALNHGDVPNGKLEDNRILDIKEITKNVGKYTIRSSNGYKMVYTYEVKADVLGVVDMR